MTYKLVINVLFFLHHVANNKLIDFKFFLLFTFRLDGLIILIPCFFARYSGEYKFISFVFFGTFLLIAIQMLFNIAVNIGLLPTKGLTLPFISYGGTSIIIMLKGSTLIDDTYNANPGR